MPITVVIDTNILVDIFLESRSRYADAKKLGQLLSENRFLVKLPMHAFFELSSALRSEKANKHSTEPMPYNPEYTEKAGFRLDQVPIDEIFLNKYLDTTLPYLKGGDFIFLCMAKKDGSELITEDKKLYDAAKGAGVNVYSIKEFMEAFLRS